MKYKWVIKEQKEISNELLNIAYDSEIIARLLLNRGIDSPEKAKAYLNPKYYKESKPEEIPDLVKAKNRILEAIDKNEKITIFGDYDVDGVTSTACLLTTLREFTENVDFYIPSRLTEGYGLNLEAVKTIAKKNRVETCHGKSLLITCDCGITNLKEVELANELGVDVIITDHHSLPEILPPAHAILNPKQLPADHKLHWLPGVGVAYKLAEAILEEKGSPKLKKEDLLDLVALGMIADLAPLVDENRYLVQIGLEKLAKTNKVGLQELLRICGCLKSENGDKPNAEHVGFGIAPRINAVGRLTDAGQAVKLLTTDNLIEAIHIATELESQNRERQLICEETLKEAVLLVSEQVDLKKDKCIVIAKENWHHGVIGIVASRVVERFHLPTILIAIDKEQNIARGSGRSIEKLNIVDALTSNSSHLEKYGGHKAACGLSIKPEKINDFIFDFKNFTNQILAEENIEAKIKIDSVLPLNKLNLELIEKIYKLSPFGLGNPLPVFESNEVEIVGIRPIGKNGQHLKLMLCVIARSDSDEAISQKQSRSSEIASLSARNDTRIFEALIWNHDPNTEFHINDRIKIIYTPKLNHFNGETFIQLEIKDWQITEEDIRKKEEKATREIIELYDFRGKAQECLGLFSKELNTQYSILNTLFFAELEQKNYLPLKTCSRNKLIKVKSLVFLESPPDKDSFTEIIKLSNAENIYLSITRSQSFTPHLLLKNLTGLLKYTVNNKNSLVKEEELQVALGINKTALAFALETLVKIGFLSYKKNINELSINISTPSRQNFDDLLEYNLLTSELKQILNFKQWLYESELTEVVKVLSEHDLKINITDTERIRIVL